MARNNYPGPCYRCGDTVNAGAGFYERVRDHQKATRAGQGSYNWLTQHAACAIVFRGTRQMATVQPVEPWLLEELRTITQMPPKQHMEANRKAEALRNKRIRAAAPLPTKPLVVITKKEGDNHVHHLV